MKNITLILFLFFFTRRENIKNIYIELLDYYPAISKNNQTFILSKMSIVMTHYL